MLLIAFPLELQTTFEEGKLDFLWLPHHLLSLCCLFVLMDGESAANINNLLTDWLTDPSGICLTNTSKVPRAYNLCENCSWCLLSQFAIAIPRRIASPLRHSLCHFLCSSDNCARLAICSQVSGNRAINWARIEFYWNGNGSNAVSFEHSSITLLPIERMRNVESASVLNTIEYGVKPEKKQKRKKGKSLAYKV